MYLHLSRDILVLVLFLGVHLLVEGVPTRVKSPGSLGSQEELGNVDEEAQDAGVLQRLWSGISTGLGSLAGYGMQNIDGRLERFQQDGLVTLQEELRSLLDVRHRQRRAHALDTKLFRDEKGYYRLMDLDSNVNSILKSFDVPSNGISMVVFEHQNFLFWFVTESFTHINFGRLHVYALHMDYQLLTTSVNTMGATKCVPVLLMDSFVEFVCVESQGEQAMDKTRVGCGIYRMTWVDGISVVFHRTLRTNGAQDVAIWVLGGYTYLAFANSYDHIRKTGEISNVLFRMQTMTLDGEVYTTYDRLDSASFGSMNARGVVAFKIVSRQFLAIANHADDLGNVEIDSDIFVYDLDHARLRPFQRVRTSGARDWAAFSFVSGPNAEYFLAVANEYKYDKAGNKNFEVDSVIYKYDDGKFVPFQCIRTFGAREWVVYQGPNGEFVLAVVNSQAGIFFYQYNGWRFVLSPFKASRAGVERAWISWVPKTLNEVVLAVVNPFEEPSRPLVYYLKFEHRNPLATYHSESLQWCVSYKSVMDDGLNHLLTRVRNAPKTNGSFTFTQPVNIHGNLVLQAGPYMSRMRGIHVRGQDYSVNFNFSSFTGRVEDVNEAFQRIAKARTTVALSKKVTRPDLNGLHFSNVEFQCKTSGIVGCRVDNLQAERINGISSLFEEALMLDQNAELFNLSFANVEVTGGAVAEVAYLSGPGFPRTPITELVTLSGSHHIVGQKTFGLLKANELRVSGTVDSVYVDEKNLLLTVKEQNISSSLTVETITTPHIQTLTLNGRDFSQFHRMLVLNNTNQHIMGPLDVSGDLIARFIRTRQAPTPVDPRTVMDKALFHNTESTQEITGAHTIGSLTVQRGLTVQGRINGVAVPEEVFLRDRSETITQPATFENIRADSVIVRRALGDIRVRDGELDLLLLNGDQEVFAKKTFSRMTVLGHSTVSRTVSGYKIEDFQKMLISNFVKGVNSGRKILGSVAFLDDLQLTEGVLDGVRISDIFNYAIPLNTNNISTTVIFEDHVKVVGDISVTSQLNGKKPKDYVLKGVPHIFTRDVAFTSDLKVEGNVNVQTVNGFDLDQLVSQFVMRDKVQNIVQDVYLYNPEIMELTVQGKVHIDGVDLDDVVTLDSTAIITGAKTFTAVDVISHVTAGAVELAPFGTVDDVIVDDLFFDNSLRKTGGSVQHLVGRSLNVLITSSVTGTDFAAFERSIVYKDSTIERIAGSLTFTGPVSVQDLTFSGSFDGVSAEDYKSGWLMKTGGQTLTGVNVMRNMEASQVTFTGNLIQGANLEHLIRSTAKIDEATTLQQVSFEKLISKKEVMLSGTIQGWNLNEEAMTSNRIMQKVTGKKMFTSNVHFAGPFPVAQYVVVRNYPEDDPFPIDVGDLCNRVGTPGTKLNLKRWTIGGDVDFGKNVTITGTLNGEDVATLEDVFWLSDVPNEIAAVASFDSLNHGANVSLVLDVTGKINGHNLNTVWDQVLKKECREQIVNGEFTIDTLITDFLVTDTVTNPNDDAGVMDLLNILLKDGDQEIKGRLNIVKVDSKGNILLDGTLNGLKIGTDFVQYGKTATITSRKTFMHNLIIQGDLVVVDEGTIQGVDVSELGRLAVRINDASVHTIPGVTTFRGLVYTGLDFQVYGTVDGITINRDTILLKSDNQEMHGVLVINPGVPGVVLETRTLIVLDNKFNDLDLDRLSNYTVRIDRPNVIYGEVTFEDVCYFQSLTLENNLINGYNINDLGQFINGTYLSIMEDYLVISLEVAQDTRLILADKGAEIWYYEESSLESMYKILAVMLKSNYLEEKAYDTLVGLDRTLNLVHTYSITPGFPKLYPAVSVAEPVAVAGLGSGLLATCGGQQMSASPSGVQQTADYTLIPTETGIQNNYGHIHSLAGEVGLETAFGINQCRDLVSFRLNDNRLCLAVLDYKASSTVMCGFASTGFRLMNYLGTQRAVKGAWVNLGYITCLFVAEEESDSEPGYLKLFKHNDYVDEMQLVRTLEVPGASDVDVLVKESLAVVVVTSRPNRLCNSSIMVFGITVDNLEIEVYQKLEVFEAVHSSLSLLPMGEVALFIQTRRNLFVYYLKGAKFVFIREIKTTPSMCPSSFPFLYGEPKTLMIPYAGLGWLYSEYHEDTLKLVPSTMYKAVYRGTYGEPLYRGMKI